MPGMIQVRIKAVHTADGQSPITGTRTFTESVRRNALHAAVVEMALTRGMMEALTVVALNGQRFPHFFDSNAEYADGLNVHQQLIVDFVAYHQSIERHAIWLRMMTHECCLETRNGIRTADSKRCNGIVDGVDRLLLALVAQARNDEGFATRFTVVVNIELYVGRLQMVDNNCLCCIILADDAGMFTSAESLDEE